jgi:hypothetical protein
MKEQFQHKLMTSFALWFDNYLLKKGEAYENKTGQFFYYSDDRVDSNFKVFGSPYKQFVTDSSITGANIPTGVYINGTEYTRNDGVVFDFENGRILSQSFATGAAITGSFAVKDFNLYFTNEDEEDLLIERKYNETSSYEYANTNIDPYDDSIPAVFISSQTFTNEPFAFGGEDKTQTAIKCIIISNDAYKLDGILSIFADSRYEVFQQIPFSSHPINEYGDLKNGVYNYQQLSNTYKGQDSVFYIENVFASKISQKAQKQLPANLVVGFLDFDIFTHRFPRA